MADCKLIRFFTNHVKGIAMRLMEQTRFYYHHNKTKRNNNKNPSIICNNCTGGVILHDLELMFNSPTINTLFYNFDDFIFFVQNLRKISKLVMFEIKEHKSYPVGGVELNNRILKIGLVHYNTFEEGKKKWEERFKRVDFNNVYVIWEGKNISLEELEQFENITFPKIVFSSKDNIKEKRFHFYHGHELYNNWYPGKILDYKSLFSRQRFLDDFDYIGFINH